MAYLRPIDDPGIFCDSTVFSDFSTPSSESFEIMNPAPSPAVEPKTSAPRGLKAEGPFPVLPPCTNFSVLGNPEQFQAYIKVQLPLAYAGPDATEFTNKLNLILPSLAPQSASAKLRRNEVNSTFLTKLLAKPYLTATTMIDWVAHTVFKPTSWPDNFQFNSAKVAREGTKLFKDAEGTTLSSLPEDMSEASARTWLNNIAHNLASVHQIARPSVPGLPDRCFDSSTSTQGPTGAFALRKPDIIVIDRPHRNTKPVEERVDWRNIYAFVEITSMTDSAGSSHVITQIAQKAACIFDAQPQRVYVCGLGIYGKIDASLRYVFVVVDHAGVVHTQATVLETYNIDHFLRIIYGFCFGSMESLGWDPTMEVDKKTNKLRSISVIGYGLNSTVETTEDFEVIRMIHSSPILYGRGTRVWIVRAKDGTFYILKDSWILEDGSVSEIEMLKHIAKTLESDPEGYLFKYALPMYHLGQESVHTTNTIRFKVHKRSARVQRRIVTGPIGDPITSFRSKAEFVSVCLDIVNGMYHSCVSYDGDT